jgi:hypothetical protein
MQVHARVGDDACCLAPVHEGSEHAIERRGSDGTRQQQFSTDGVQSNGAYAGPAVTGDVALLFRACQGAGVPADAIARAAAGFHAHLHAVGT